MRSPRIERVNGDMVFVCPVQGCGVIGPCTDPTGKKSPTELMTAAIEHADECDDAAARMSG